MTFFDSVWRMYARELLETEPVTVGEWQSMKVGESKLHATHELLNRTHIEDVPRIRKEWDAEITPDQPWAEEHFIERTSGIPYNPPPSHVRWPYGFTNRHQDIGGKFDHTYPERFWPRHAGGCHHGYAPAPPEVGGIQTVDMHGQGDYSVVCDGRQGIRFRYGDLQDVVNLLIRSPFTRQAYLPVWFPEDTGAHAGQRVPCTLGYHFIIRDAKLHCAYFIRSCDLVRHFRNDVYFAGRLMQWVADKVAAAAPMIHGGDVISAGRLTMHITSLHLFVGDVPKVRAQLENIHE